MPHALSPYVVCGFSRSGAVLPSGSKNAAVGVKDLSIGVPYSDLIVGVPRELHPGERRVAQTPGEDWWKSRM